MPTVKDIRRHYGNEQARPDRTLNTSRILEEDLRYEDESDDIAFMCRAPGWRAMYEDGSTRAVAFWVTLGSSTVYRCAPPAGAKRILGGEMSDINVSSIVW